jgi:hypothetical protein
LQHPSLLSIVQQFPTNFVSQASDPPLKADTNQAAGGLGKRGEGERGEGEERGKGERGEERGEGGREGEGEEGGEKTMEGGCI